MTKLSKARLHEKLPNLWVIKQWNDVAEICYGKDQKQVEEPQGKYKIYGTGGLMSYANKYLYNKPSVLIGRKGTIDNPFFIDEPFWTVDTLYYTKIRKGYIPKWFYYVVDSTPLKKYNEATGVPSLSRANLNKINIAVPPLPEQRKIADILSTVDEKIEAIDQRIALTQELKKGLMQRLLTKGIGHTRFKDSPLGKIPESWEVVKVGQISDVKGGKRLPKGEQLIESKTNHPYIRVSDMYMGGVSLDEILYVPDHVYPKISKYTISENDLFISVAGTLGLVGKIPSELDGANLTENADKITNLKVEKEFMLQVMLSPIIQDAVKKERTNNAQPKLALTRIKTFLIPKPSNAEQQKIAKILSTIDEKLVILQDKKQEYQQLKKGLMQQLLTGKIRVVID